MKMNHMVGGTGIFGVGLFMALSNILYVVEFIKGCLQPVFLVIGMCAASAAIFNSSKTNRKLNTFLSIFFSVLGCYGIYDEYYGTMDFINGLVPPLLIGAGIVAMIHGITKLK